jgi:hypothetical protein
MSDYQLTASEEPCAVILTEEDGTVWHIPPDPANRHYAEYLQWVENGGVPDPYVAPPPAPPYVDPNARLDAGIAAAIGAAEAVRNGIHAVPNNFNAANFQAFLIQAKALSDAFVAMLEAQQGPPPP